MNKIKVDIWNRSFELRVVSDENDMNSISEKQKEVIDDLFVKNKEVLEDFSEIFEYCKKKNKEEICSDNIFKYVMPKYLYIIDTENKCVAIMCDYKFDMEHGIAVVYENDKLTKVVEQDYIL